MHPVNSSNIAEVGYEGTTLTIKFHSGAIWDYYDVPESVHNELLAATSAGSYFFKSIRNQYRGELRT